MKIIEIFKSLQGEGPLSGTVTLFVRLSGCNLNCRWCDTKKSHNGGVWMSAEEIFEKIEKSGVSYVCITGGEPLLSKEELIPLLRILHNSGYKTEIETNGTIDFSDLQDYAQICMDVKCPSSGEMSDLELLKNLRKDDSVKFVVSDEADFCYAKDIIENYLINSQIFISPVWGSNCKKTAQMVITSGLPVRFQIQLHKIIGVE